MDMRAVIKKYTILAAIISGSFSACQPKEIDTISVSKIWKAKSVKENGTVVYTEGSSGNTRPGYTRFRLDMSQYQNVVYTDVDGRKLSGKWSLSTDYKRLILTELTPPPSETSGNIEFYIVKTSPDLLNLKRTNESRKTGNTVNEYELVPE
jgi:hypothetical protein